ncbi:MAG: hypothetical protein R6V59_09345 [Dehalococcoidia bacterium]
MRNITTILLSALILCSALVVSACDSSEPEIEIEADFITVGFEDHSTMELTKGSPEFKEINDEAVRIYRDICDTMEELVGPDCLEEIIKYNNKFVEIEFIEPPSVTTYTDEGEVYRILNCRRAISVFTGEFAGAVLCGPTSTEWQEYAVLGSRRSFSKLEKMVDALRS